jgi:hypothetical protein
MILKPTSDHERKLKSRFVYLPVFKYICRLIQMPGMVGYYTLSYRFTFVPTCVSLYISTCLSIHLLIYLPMYLRTYLPIYLPTCPPIYLLPTSLTACLLLYLNNYLFFIYLLSIYRFMYLFVYLFRHV